LEKKAKDESTQMNRKRGGERTKISVKIVPRRNSEEAGQGKSLTDAVWKKKGSREMGTKTGGRRKTAFLEALFNKYSPSYEDEARSGGESAFTKSGKPDHLKKTDASKRI